MNGITILWPFFIISRYLNDTLPKPFIAIKTSPFAIMIGRATVPVGDERLANPLKHVIALSILLKRLLSDRVVFSATYNKFAFLRLKYVLRLIPNASHGFCCASDSIFIVPTGRPPPLLLRPFFACDAENRCGVKWVIVHFAILFAIAFTSLGCIGCI